MNKKRKYKKYWCPKCGALESIPESEWNTTFTGIWCPLCRRKKMHEVIE